MKSTKDKIIESLKTRRKTLSELSSELGLSPPTVYGHLKAMEEAGIVRKVDEGRKWKYYELVPAEKPKGTRIIREFVLVVLGIIGLVAAYIGLNGLVGIRYTPTHALVSTSAKAGPLGAPRPVAHTYLSTYHAVLTLIGIALIVFTIVYIILARKKHR